MEIRAVIIDLKVDGSSVFTAQSCLHSPITLNRLIQKNVTE
jgi:hypothetical protein